MKTKHITVNFVPYKHNENRIRDCVARSFVESAGAISYIADPSFETLMSTVYELVGLPAYIDVDKRQLHLVATLGTVSDIVAFNTLVDNMTAQYMQLSPGLVTNGVYVDIVLKAYLDGLQPCYKALLPALSKLAEKSITVKMAVISNFTKDNGIVHGVDDEAAAEIAVHAACGLLGSGNGVYTYEQQMLTLDESKIDAIIYTGVVDRLKELRTSDWYNEYGLPNTKDPAVVEARDQMLKLLFADMYGKNVSAENLGYRAIQNGFVEKALPETVRFCTGIPDNWNTMTAMWDSFVRSNKRIIEEEIPELLLKDWYEGVRGRFDLLNTTWDVTRYIKQLAESMETAESAPAYPDSGSEDRSTPGFLANKEKFWQGKYIEYITRKKAALAPVIKYYTFKALKAKMNALAAELEERTRAVEGAYNALTEDLRYLDAPIMGHYKTKAENLFNDIDFIIRNTEVTESSIRKLVDTLRNVDYATAWQKIVNSCVDGVKGGRNTNAQLAMIFQLMKMSPAEIINARANLQSDSILLLYGGATATRNSGYVRIGKIDSGFDTEQLAAIYGDVCSLQPQQHEEVKDSRNINALFEYKLTVSSRLETDTYDALHLEGESEHLFELYGLILRKTGAWMQYGLGRKPAANTASTPAAAEYRPAASANTTFRAAAPAAQDTAALPALDRVDESDDGWTFYFKNLEGCYSAEMSMEYLNAGGMVERPRPQTLNLGRPNPEYVKVTKNGKFGTVKFRFRIQSVRGEATMEEMRQGSRLRLKLVKTLQKGTVKINDDECDKYCLRIEKDGADVDNGIVINARYRGNRVLDAFVYPLVRIIGNKKMDYMVYVKAGAAVDYIPDDATGRKYRLTVGEE